MDAISMLSLSDCMELTETRSSKPGDTAQKADGDSLGDGCIPVSIYIRIWHIVARTCNICI